MNLFVLKQINLLGLEVTASESLAVGYLLGLSLIQEFYGRKAARQHVLISMTVSIGFLILAWVHLSYSPNSYDLAHSLYVQLLKPLPRLIGASLLSFLTIQVVDIAFFQYLRQKTQGKWFAGRTGLTLILSQLLDTLLFSFLGLYGLVHNIIHIMIVSFTIKVVVIFFSLPFVQLSKSVMGPGKSSGNETTDLKKRPQFSN